MLKIGHGLLKQAFLVVTILALMISLLSVGVVQAPKPPKEPKPPKDTPLYSIEIDSLVVDSGTSFVTEGNRKGTSFSGGEAHLVGTVLAGLKHHGFSLHGLTWTLGDSGFGGGTLALRFNYEEIPQVVYRLHIYLDVEGNGPEYTDTSAEIFVWHLEFEPGPGKSSRVTHTDNVAEATGEVTVTIT